MTNVAKMQHFYFFINTFMITFIKASLREFKHVVWPTKEETRKYFTLVLSILIFFWIYLFIVNNIFSSALFALKDLVK